MRRLDQISGKLLLELFRSSDGLELFTLWRRFQIDPAHLLMHLEKLKKSGLIHIEKTKIKISEVGEEWVMTNRMLLLSSGHQPWKNVPNDFSVPQLNPNTPYAPSIPRLHRSIQIKFDNQDTQTSGGDG